MSSSSPLFPLLPRASEERETFALRSYGLIALDWHGRGAALLSLRPPFLCGAHNIPAEAGTPCAVSAGLGFLSSFHLFPRISTYF
jgi:hypothetical protein